MKIFLFLGTLALLASCTQPPAPTPTPTPAPKVMEDTKMMKDEAMMKAEEMKKDMMMSGTDMMKKDEMMKADSTMMKDESKMMKPTGYMEYDEAKVKEALASGQKVALFFHASWCPSCRALDKAITADAASIPTNALIVKVDYDASEDMKKKYGVTSQHTTVIVDADMALISKKTGARTITDIWN